MDTFFKFLLAGIFCFAGFCLVMLWVYIVMARNRFSIRHPEEYLKWLNQRSFWQPWPWPKEMAILCEQLDDDKLTIYWKKAHFWFKCGASTVLMALLVGILI